MAASLGNDLGYLLAAHWCETGAGLHPDVHLEGALVGPGDLFTGVGMPVDKGLPEIVQAELHGFFRLIVTGVREMVQHY